MAMPRKYCLLEKRGEAAGVLALAFSGTVMMLISGK